MADAPTTCVIWYGFEITPAGELGPRAVLRLQKARDVANATGGTIVLSTGSKPGHTAQKVPTRELAATWLAQQGFTRVLIVADDGYSTEAELDCGVAVGGRREVHVSSWWHIPRIWILRRRKRPVADGVAVTYACVWDFPLKSIGKECLKLFAMLFPERVQRRLKAAYQKVLGDTQQ